MILAPDLKNKNCTKTEIVPNFWKLVMRLVLAWIWHPFRIHQGSKVDVDVFMCALKRTRSLGSRTYTLKDLVTPLYAVYQDVTGNAKDIAMDWRKGVGAARWSSWNNLQKEETEEDLFENKLYFVVVLTALIEAGFEVLDQAGYAPELAYVSSSWNEIDCGLGSTKVGFKKCVNHPNTAEYGDYVSGPRVITKRGKKIWKLPCLTFGNGNLK